jgi:hypothetical protein
MTYRGIFDAKITGTPVSVTFSFALELAVGETLSSASVAATVYSGTDAIPGAIISGSAAISEGQVTQIIINGVEGVTYLLTATVTTSAGESLTREGYLVIAPEVP